MVHRQIRVHPRSSAAPSAVAARDVNRVEMITHPVVRRFASALVVIFAAGSAHGQAGPTASSAPDETRFTRTVLADGLDEPIQVEFDPQGRVYWIERGGGVKR